MFGRIPKIVELVAEGDVVILMVQLADNILKEKREKRRLISKVS